MTPQQRYQQRRIAEGLCGQCGKNPLATTVRCRECADAHNARNARRWTRLRNNGLCKVCGRRPSRPNKTLCERCAGMAAGYKQDAKARAHGKMEDLIDVIHGLFRQTCGAEAGKYDHAGMSTYKKAQDILLSANRIQPDHVYPCLMTAKYYSRYGAKTTRNSSTSPPRSPTRQNSWASCARRSAPSSTGHTWPIRRKITRASGTVSATSRRALLTPVTTST